MSQYNIKNRWKPLVSLAAVGLASCSAAAWFANGELKREYRQWYSSVISDDSNRREARAVAEDIKWYVKGASEREEQVLRIYHEFSGARESAPVDRKDIVFAGLLLQEAVRTGVLSDETAHAARKSLVEKAISLEIATKNATDTGGLERAADIYHALGREDEERRVLQSEVDARMQCGAVGLERVLNTLHLELETTDQGGSYQSIARLSLRRPIYQEYSIVPSTIVIERLSTAACNIADYWMRQPSCRENQGCDTLRCLWFAADLIERLDGQLPEELRHKARESVSFLLESTTYKKPSLQSSNDFFTPEEMLLQSLGVAPQEYRLHAQDLHLEKYMGFIDSAQVISEKFALKILPDIAIGWWNIAMRARPWQVDVRAVEPSDQCSIAIFEKAAQYAQYLPVEQRQEAQCYLAAGLSVAGWKNGVPGWCSRADKLYADAGLSTDSSKRKRVLELKQEAQDRKALFEIGGRRE